jgi:hypothetical protein
MAIYKCISCGGKYGPLIADPFKMEIGFKTNDGNHACSQACARSWNAALQTSGNNSNSGENQSNSGNEEAKAQAEQAKAQAAEAKSKENASKWNAAAQLGTAAFSAATSTGKEVKETTDYLAKLIFSNDAEELGNQLSEICSMWGGAEKYMIKDNTEAVKKAAFEKFEFGFMKLKQVGMPHQIEFFTKKQKEMKPKRFGFF